MEAEVAEVVYRYPELKEAEKNSPTTYEALCGGPRKTLYEFGTPELTPLCDREEHEKENPEK